MITKFNSLCLVVQSPWMNENLLLFWVAKAIAKFYIKSSLKTSQFYFHAHAHHFTFKKLFMKFNSFKEERIRTYK